ncbi:MAG: DedA family protein [Bacteriovoracia bacterium]
MFHHLLTTWFQLVDQWGYWGVFLLMALESSIVPVPSEIVMPPAAFWAAQGRMSFALVVLAGTAGSYFGSMVSYFVSLYLGKPFVDRYGKYVLLKKEKIEMAANWVHAHGAAGIFFSRLLPVIRHLISIPAGILKMNFLKFSASTILGAGLWCLVLSWFGKQVIGENPELLASPEQMITVLKAKLHYFVLAVFVLALGYLIATKGVRPSRKRVKA